MKRYVLMRLFQALITFWILSIVIFIIGRATGDPISLMLPEDAGDEARETLRRALDLDKPIYVQYWTFITGFLQGDLGQSIRVRQPVTELVKERAANSIKLGLAAMSLTVLLGVPLGVLSAVKRNSIQDTLAKIFAILGQSMPMFWMGIVLIQVFAGQLDLLPAAGTGGPAHYILPAFTLGVFLIAAVMRLVRSSMLEALDTEYIKLARVKGVPEWKIIWKHALRNSLVPVVSFGGTYVAILLTGAILVETVFAWPGLGDLVYKGIIWRDFPIIQAVVLLTAVVVVASNFVTDILYAYLIPIRCEKAVN
jgi:ABC-type dipeptide/oligopeptide/nickel transport system permease component